MSRLTVSDRLRLASLAADKSRRAAMSRLLYSPVLRWRYGAPVADQLLIVPQDLRTADPSFWHEVVLDHFGLAGTVAALDGKSPFEVRPPHQAWAYALHGFGWLRHLAAADNDEAKALASKLAVEWIMRSSRPDAKFTWLPNVTARRVISWISHSNILLDGANQRTYDTIVNSLGQQLVRLSAEWRDTPGGYPRLLVLNALVLADLTIAGHDRRLADAERAFAAELQRQVLPDGGHISRNPRVLVELMLDLLPLRQCFAARGRPYPPGLIEIMQRMLTMLRYLRLGDGRLVRFNGTGVAASAGLATVLAYDDRPSQILGEATHSRYVRLQKGDTIIVMDAGAPPPLEYAGEAYAGCLSFEVSVGPDLLMVNGGAPAPVDAQWRPAARATASHNTLCLAETSSSELVRHKGLEALIGAAPIKDPENVDYKAQQRDGAIVVGAQHDGYLRRYGLKHARRISLSEDGSRIDGTDRVREAGNSHHLTHDLPFSIHFHLHPDVLCERSEDPDQAELMLPSGERWLFTIKGAALSLEAGTFFADSSGPTRVMQLVARGATSGQTEVTWSIERVAVEDGPAADSTEEIKHESATALKDDPAKQEASEVQTEPEDVDSKIETLKPGEPPADKQEAQAKASTADKDASKEHGIAPDKAAISNREAPKPESSESKEDTGTPAESATSDPKNDTKPAAADAKTVGADKDTTNEKDET